MKKVLLTLVIAVLLLSGFAGVKSAEPLFVSNSTTTSQEDPANEIIVGYKENTDVAVLSKQVEKTTGAKLSRKGLKNFAVFKLPQGKAADVVMNQLKNDPNVEYVEQITLLTLLTIRMTLSSTHTNGTSTIMA